MEMDIRDFADEITQQVRDWVDENMSPMTHEDARKGGLDTRAVYAVYYNADCIAVQGSSSKRTLEYYGGFEYIGEDHRRELGEFTFYMREDANGDSEYRVASVIDAINGIESEEEED